MEVRRHRGSVEEALKVVGLTVLVEVVQPGDLVAALDVDDSVDDFQAERFEQAGGVALPGKLAEVALKAIYDPHVAVPGGDRRAVLVDEIESGEAEV